MALRKTLEELRASARERSRRWRSKNRELHRQRVMACYGLSKNKKLQRAYDKELAKRLKKEPKKDKKADGKEAQGVYVPELRV
jgi:hypothetical protein